MWDETVVSNAEFIRYAGNASGVLHRLEEETGALRYDSLVQTHLQKKEDYPCETYIGKLVHSFIGKNSGKVNWLEIPG